MLKKMTNTVDEQKCSDLRLRKRRKVSKVQNKAEDSRLGRASIADCTRNMESDQRDC